MVLVTSRSSLLLPLRRSCTSYLPVLSTSTRSFAAIKTEKATTNEPNLRYLGNRFTEITGHNYGWSRSYYGPLKGVILDWSGTTADKYVIAPAEVFVKVFAKYGVPISMLEAREPMGLRKDLHIAEICKNPAVRARWTEAKGKKPDQGDVDAMFKDFVPAQLEVRFFRRFRVVVPGGRRVKDYFGCRRNWRFLMGVLEGFDI